MQPVLAIFAIVVGVAILGRFLQVVVPSQASHGLRKNIGFGLVAAGVVLMFLRQFGLALVLFIAGASMALRRGAGMGQSAGGGKSRVGSAYLEMTLDHDTGDMDGAVLSGAQKGRMLSDFDLAGLFDLSAEFNDDAESVKLLETYLDRAHPNWRDEAGGFASADQDMPPNSRRISKDAAYRVLGLAPGASESEVRDAHHRLIKRVHPDHGGTAELAAQINEARDRLLESR